MVGPDDRDDAYSADGPDWLAEPPSPQRTVRHSNGGMLVGAGALVVAAVALFLYFNSSDDKAKPGSADGIGLAVQQPGQIPAQQQQRPVQQPPAQQPQSTAGDQITTLNMQFTQTLLRSDGRCPANVPPAGQDFSPKTTSKVTINKTKRTIQIENTDGTKSDVATYDAATMLAVIGYQGQKDNRASVVKLTDTTLEGESTFFPFRGLTGQGVEQYTDCRFILKTTAKVA